MATFMSNKTKVALIVFILLFVLSAFFFSERVRSVLAAAAGWMVFLILLPVAIDLYRKNKTK